MIQTRKHVKPRERTGSREGLKKVASLLGGTAAGAAFSFASLPFGLSPFGTAAAAVTTSDAWADAGLMIGSAAGYLLQGAGKFIYLAGALLALPLRRILNFLFPRLSAKTASTAASVTALLFCQCIIAASGGFLTFDLISGGVSIICGGVFCAFASVCAPVLLRRQLRAGGLTQTESAALLTVIAVLLLPFSDIAFYDISPARVMGVLCVLCCGVFGGAAQGGMSGAIMGTVLSLGGENISYIIAAYSVGGVVAGLIGRKGRLRAVIAFMGTAAVVTLCIDSSLTALAALCEASLACGLYSLTPEKWADALGRLLSLRDASPSVQADRLCRYVAGRLDEAAENLDGISRLLSPAEAQEKAGDLQASLEKSAEKICRDCPCCNSCWGENYTDSANALNRARRVLEKRTLTLSDLPEYFLARCKEGETLTEAFNFAGAAWRAAKASEYDAERNRTVMAAQFASLSQLIGELGQGLREPLRFDTVLAGRVMQYFAGKGSTVERLAAFRDGRDALFIEAALRRRGSPSDRQTLTDLNELCSAQLTVLECAEKDGLWQLRLGLREKYRLEIAGTSLCKNGESCCGDAWTDFRPGGYLHAVCLADGMGSGETAHRQANLACELMGGIMKSGFDPERALRLLNSTLLLSTDATSFSTLDLAAFDLFSGRADLYKLGASGTHIIRNGRAYEVPCCSLPAGIMGSAVPTHRFFTVRDGDLILMSSDGAEPDSAILSACAADADGDLESLCSSLMRRMQLMSADDDMTLLLIRVKTR